MEEEEVHCPGSQSEAAVLLRNPGSSSIPGSLLAGAPRSPYPPARGLGSEGDSEEAQRQGLAANGSERVGDLLSRQPGPRAAWLSGSFPTGSPPGSFMWSGTVVSGWGSLDPD